MVEFKIPEPGMYGLDHDRLAYLPYGWSSHW